MVTTMNRLMRGDCPDRHHLLPFDPHNPIFNHRWRKRLGLPSGPRRFGFALTAMAYFGFGLLLFRLALRVFFETSLSPAIHPWLPAWLAVVAAFVGGACGAAMVYAGLRRLLSTTMFPRN